MKQTQKTQTKTAGKTAKLKVTASENVAYLWKGKELIGVFALSELEVFAKAKDNDFQTFMNCAWKCRRNEKEVSA
jgi:hypothetical protein